MRSTRFNAAASSAIHAVLSAPPRPARLLGAMDGAIYFHVESDVVGVLTSDSVRLPCAVVLGFSSRERSLAGGGLLAPLPSESPMIGNGYLQWPSRAGLVVIHAVREWAPPRVGSAVAAGPGLAVLRDAVSGVDIGIPDGLIDALAADGAAPVLELLGLGPGLTPSGDDVLAGLLLGARAFGTELDGPAAEIETHAPTRTTALSAQLLRHAVRGECVRQVATVVAALDDPVALAPAIAALRRIGHTSGAALGRGLLVAALRALTPAV